MVNECENRWQGWLAAAVKGGGVLLPEATAETETAVPVSLPADSPTGFFRVVEMTAE